MIGRLRPYPREKKKCCNGVEQTTHAEIQSVVWTAALEPANVLCPPLCKRDLLNVPGTLLKRAHRITHFIFLSYFRNVCMDTWLRCGHCRDNATADASLSDATAEITCWAVQLSAVDELSPFFSFWKSCFSSGLTGAIVTTLNHRSNYDRGLKWTVVVAARIDCFHFADELVCHRRPAISGGITDTPPTPRLTTTPVGLWTVC